MEFFAWLHLIWLVERIIFKKKLSKTYLPFKFSKIGLRNTLFIFGRKNGRLFVVVLLFVATLSDFGLLFLKIEALIELRKMLLRKKLFDVWFGNCLIL